MSDRSREPQSLSNILAELNASRGYNQTWVHKALENAWNTAVGKPQCYQTRIGEVHHGVLHVTVTHSALLEELRAFHKARLIASLSGSLGIAIHDIQFRVGSIAIDAKKR